MYRGVIEVVGPRGQAVRELLTGDHAEDEGRDAGEAGAETSTAICSIAFAVAAATHVPGATSCFVAMVGFNAISTVTARTPQGDHAKAIRALRG